MIEDPIVQEIRQARERIATESNFDMHAIFEASLRRSARRKTEADAGKIAVPAEAGQQIPEALRNKSNGDRSNIKGNGDGNTSSIPSHESD